jgi:succinate dehydrogenase/fumarate reductase flavoprotein subunit
VKKNTISRRAFLKNAGAVVGGAAVGGSLMGLAGCATSGAAAGFEGGVPARWDYSTDVVVIGFGGAGAAAAIEAHDNGAKVLVLEKQGPLTINNTRMSGGVWHNPHRDGDPAALVEYIKACMSGENIPWKFEGEQPHVSDDMAKMFATGIMQIEDFLMGLDPDLDRNAMKPTGNSSFPTFPKFAEAKYGETIRTRYKNTANANSSLAPWEQAKDTKTSGEALYHALVEEGIKKQRAAIEIYYSTPAKRLVRAGNGDIQGVIAEKDGKEIAIQAKRAVILSSGGFEYSLPMRRAFQEGAGVKGWCFYGSQDNTGDGIAMAILIGAGLAKVAKSASRIEVAFPHGKWWTEDGKGLKIGAGSSVSSSRNSLVVDNYGNRYTDEFIITDSRRPYRYQFYKEAVKYDMLNMIYPRTPSWAIFDETRRAAGPVIGSGTTWGYRMLPWTRDNLDAINRGWIIKADTLDELTAKINADPENRKLMTAAALKATVARFNGFCSAGKDADFNRDPATMGPVEKPPFYALKHYPGGPNTKGGIDANYKRQALDWDGNPIPRLYTAGEISSVFKFTYQAGGNITECIVCGRKAGENAAKERPWA